MYENDQKELAQVRNLVQEKESILKKSEDQKLSSIKKLENEVKYCKHFWNKKIQRIGN